MGTEKRGGDEAAVEVDAVDEAIIAELVRDARMSARAIARAVGMSPNAVSERIDRLQARGVIEGYHVKLNPKRLGYGMLAIVGLQTVHGPAMEDTMRAILATPEVEHVHLVTGQWDLIVEIRVRNHAHLESVLLDRVWGLPAFRHSETMIALRSYTRGQTWAPAGFRRQDASDDARSNLAPPG